LRFFERIAELEHARVSFAVATVVARRSPVSSHLGDRAIVHADGRMEGFVGGSCSRDLVRRHALQALHSGKPRLLQIRPDAGEPGDSVAPADAELVIVPMGCASNGAADVYIEPYLPMRVLIVVGFTPVAESLARMAAASQAFDVVRIVSPEELRDVDKAAGVRVVALEDLAAFLAGLDSHAQRRLAAVVASQGHYDEIALEVLLRSSVDGYIGLLASHKRAADVLGVLTQAGIANDRLAIVHNPVGLDIGARSAPEVAVSILAELISSAPKISDEAVEFAIDPVCGMEVEVAAARYRTEHGGQTFYFCGAGCLGSFNKEPDRYASAARNL
jgi:xanthine dehydrogenase accessory factor